MEKINNLWQSPFIFWY